MEKGISTISRFTLIICSILLVFSACQKQTTEWKGTITEEDGVTVVKNPKEPMYGGEIFSLEEELSIGDEEKGEEYLFSQIREINVDDSGRIYVLDMREAHVRVFGANGYYLRTIGRKGQGPEELGLPSYLWITKQDELMIEDRGNLALKFFSLEGKFIRSLPLTEMPQFGRTVIDTKGNIVGITRILDPDNPQYEVQKYDPNLNILFTITSGPTYMPKNRSFNPFYPVPWFQIDKADNVVHGVTEQYKFFIFDSKGQLIKKIMKEHIPIEITEAEKERQRKLYSNQFPINLPRYHNAFYKFRLDDKGRIYVQLWEKSEDRTHTYYDIFDSDGRYLAKIPLICDARVWKDKKLYAVAENYDGYQVVKRYRVNWSY